MERTVQELVLGVVRRQTPTGASVVIEGAPGIGKTFMAREILDSVAPGEAKILRVAGQQGRRNNPFTVAGQLLGGVTGDTDPGDAAFDYVDELCADGPVVLCADDAHNLDAASLTLLRRLVWARRSLPLAVLINTRTGPSREPVTMLIRQAQVRLWLPPMGPMMVERLVFDQTGRWPGPLLRRILGLAAGNPLFVAELLRGYENAGALAEVGPDTIEARLELDLQATGLDEVIRAHLDQLDEPTRDVLAAMAVWGTDIGVDDLASMLFSSADDVLFSSADVLDELLERAVSSGLIRRDPAGTAGHEITNAYPRLPAPGRLLAAGPVPAARLHRRRRTGRGGGRRHRHRDQPPRLAAEDPQRLLAGAVHPDRRPRLHPGKNDDRWLATWGGAGVGLILGLVILALVPLMPFTEQFAREATPQAYWSSPTFKKINRVLSAAWGVAIFALGVSRVAAAAINGHTTRRLPELLLGLVVPGAIILYMLKFSQSYPDHVTHQPAEAPAAH